MAKRKRAENDSVVQRRIKEGRGQGEGKDYRPWLTLHDVASRGRSRRVKGRTTGRVHHLLSDGEFYCLLLADWNEQITDFREQYPIPLEISLEVASQLNIKHPIDPKTKRPKRITSDFVLTLGYGPNRIYLPRTYKTLEELTGEGAERVFHKLEIENISYRILSQSYPIFQPWKLVVNSDLPKTLVRNLRNMRPSWNKEKYGITDIDLRRIQNYLLPRIEEEYIPLAILAQECDAHLELRMGISLRAVQHLILRHKWIVDLNKPFIPEEPLVLDSFLALAA